MRGIYAVLAVGFALIGQAQAGTVFNVTDGAFDDSNSLSGTLTIDTIGGTVLSGDLFISSVGEFNNLFSGNAAVNFSGSDTPDYLWAVDFHSPSLPNANLQLDIYLGATDSLAGYSGGALCINEGDFSGNCGNYLSSYQLTADPYLTSGSLSAAPEPSSFLLMAGPVVWFAGRRRFRFGR